MTLTAFAPEQLTLGQEIDRLFEIREKIKTIEAKAKELQVVFDAREKALLERLEAEAVTGSRGSKASVSISDSIVPQVENWEEAWAYIHRNKAYHLIKRSMNAAAYRELLEQRKGKPVPGVVPWTKRTMKLTAV